MDHLSTSADISGRIGALELGDTLESHGDGALEAAGADLSPQPITNSLSCIRTFRCIGDGALESAAGAIMGGGPMQPTNPFAHCPATIHGVIGSPCAGDGELETAAMGLNPTQPVTNPIRFCMTNPIKFCMQTSGCIGDGELEAAAGMGLNPHPGTNTPACLQTLRLPGGMPGCVGDDALEATGATLSPFPTGATSGCYSTRRCVTDGALELAAGASMNPPITSPMNIACAHPRVSDADLEAASMAPQVTQNIVCLPRFIDDGALEAVGPGTGPRPTSHAFGCSIGPGIAEISDGELEAAGSRLTHMPTTPPDCTISPRHSCASDAALEAHSCASDAALEAAGAAWALGGPQTNLALGTMCCQPRAV